MRGVQGPPDQPGLATVPLDELTLQPDFSNDDSELSDEDTDSDSPDQSTLPQSSEWGLCLAIKVTCQAAGNFGLYWFI